MMSNSAAITSDSDFENTPNGLAQRWQTEIQASQQELLKFHQDANRITQRYLDKRDAYGKEESKVNLFWSTMQVLLSMLYARPPKADVARSFQDYDDDVARVAGTMLQRMLNRAFDDSTSEWDSAVRQGIEDWLVVGEGQIWLRYEVETEDYEVPAVFDEFGQELSPAEQAQRITDEDAPVDYIYWEDFFWSPARTWGEVRWVARRVFMTKDQLTERFGPEIANVVPWATSARRTRSTTSHPSTIPGTRPRFSRFGARKNARSTGTPRAAT